MSLRVLLTGSEGFLGRNLSSYLKARGYEVLGVDVAGSPDIKGDLSDPSFTLGKLRDESFDYIVHLAAIPNPRAFRAVGAFKALTVNAYATLLVAELARVKGASRLVFFSSSNVYGKPLKLPVAEDDPLRPFEGYGWSKVASEAILLSYRVEHKLPVVVFRLWKPYGPWDRGVVGVFLHRAVRGEPLVVHNGGVDATDFTYVLDVCKAVEASLRSDEAVGEVFNIGTGKPTTILDLARTVASVVEDELGVSVAVEVREREREAFVSYPSVEKASRLLGFKAEVGLRDGVRRTLEFILEEGPWI